MAATVQGIQVTGYGLPLMHVGDVQIASWSGPWSTIEGADIIAGGTSLPITTFTFPATEPYRVYANAFADCINGDDYVVKFELVYNGGAIASHTVGPIAAGLGGTAFAVSPFLTPGSSFPLPNSASAGDTIAVQVTFVSATVVGAGTPTIGTGLSGFSGEEPRDVFVIEQFGGAFPDLAECDEVYAITNESGDDHLVATTTSTLSPVFDVLLDTRFFGFDLDTDSSGDIFVTEDASPTGATVHPRIERFDPTGTSLGQWGPDLDSLGFRASNFTHTGSADVSIKIVDTDDVYLFGWNTSSVIQVVHLDSSGTVIHTYTNLTHADSPCSSSSGADWSVNSPLFFDIANDLKMYYDGGGVPRCVYGYDLVGGSNLGTLIDLDDVTLDPFCFGYSQALLGSFGAIRCLIGTGGGLAILRSHSSGTVPGVEPPGTTNTTWPNTIPLIDARIDLFTCRGDNFFYGYVPLNIPIYLSGTTAPRFPQLLALTDTRQKLWGPADDTGMTIDKAGITDASHGDAVSFGQGVRRIVSCERRLGDGLTCRVRRTQHRFTAVIG